MDGDIPVLPKMLSISPPRRSICSTMPVAAAARTTGGAAPVVEGALPTAVATAENAGSTPAIGRPNPLPAAS